ncbi:MAG TPA: hypothetical protein DCZ03_13075 [Gammaproteobacteria bacterium]|nr:hypothetical protein [Gammaproteobacteria bacterium]
MKPYQEERIGRGEIGFDIQLHGKRNINLGNTLLLKKAWQKRHNPEVLMVPIGGKTARIKMDVEEAVQAGKIIQPKLAIPWHHNCPGLFTRISNPADDAHFKVEAENTDTDCKILRIGDQVELSLG